MTTNRAWRLATLAAYLVVAGIAVCAAQPGNVPGVCTNTPYSAPCGPSGGGNQSNNASARAANLAYKRYSSSFDRAVKLYNQGIKPGAAQGLSLCQSALSFIDDALENEPGDGAAQTSRRRITSCISSANGTLAVLRGDFDQGINYYREAESEYPESNELWEKNIAWAESKRQQANANAQARAEGDREREMKAQRNALWAHGLELLSNKDYAGAEAVWRQMIALDPQNSAAYYNFGLALFYQNSYTEAETAFRKSAELNPKDPDAELELGNVLKAQNRYTEAEAAYRSEIQLATNQSDGQNGLGNVLFLQGRNAEAEVAFRTSISEDPNNALPLLDLGWMLLGEERNAEAELLYRQATQLDPGNLFAQVRLGDALSAQNKYAEAEAAYRKALELSPGDANIQQALQSVIDEEKKAQQELASQQQTTASATAATTPERPQQRQAQVSTLFAQGNQLFQSNDYKGAEAAWRKVVTLDPQNSAAYYGVGLALSNQKRYAEAEVVLRQALQLNPSDFPSHYALGLALVGEHRFAEAEPAFRKALELKPDDEGTQQAIQLVLQLEKKVPMSEELKAALKSRSSGGTGNGANASPSQKAMDEANSTNVATGQGLQSTTPEGTITGTREDAVAGSNKVWDTTGDKIAAPPVDLRGVGKAPAIAALLSHIPQNDKVKNDSVIQTSVDWYSHEESHKAETRQKIAEIQKQIDSKQGDPGILKIEETQYTNDLEIIKQNQKRAEDTIKKQLITLDMPWIEQPETPESKSKEKLP